MADQSKKDYYERRKSALVNERQTFIQQWKDCQDFISPRRGRFFIQDRNKGDRRWTKIINSAGTQAHRVATSGMYAGTANPSRPWFGLETDNTDLMEFGPVKDWLYRTTGLLNKIFADSNFYNMYPTMLGELLQFGTACMSHVDDYNDVARFYTHTIGSYMIAQNDRYDVDTLVREFEWSVSQIVGAFGYDNCSQQVKDQYDRSNYDAWFPVVHFIEPNQDYSRNKPGSQYKKFKSCYYECGGDKNKLLSEKGFDEFPAYCVRWQTTGEDIYGTDCPAMTALGDIKGLQLEEKQKAQAIAKMVNPPLKGPQSLRNVPVSSLPGGLTIYDSAGNANDGLQPIYQVKPDLSAMRDDMQQYQQRIDQAFFVDLFMAISQMEGIQPRNQYDLMQRNEERLVQLGPVLERLNNDFFNKLIDRTFNQAIRARILPPIPQELAGQNLKVNYISSLSMAQKSVATTNIEKLAGYVGNLRAMGFVDITDKFDADQSVDEYGQIVGAPPRLVVSDDVVAQKREVRAKQMALQQAMATAQQGAGIAQTLSNAALPQQSEGGPQNKARVITGG